MIAPRKFVLRFIKKIRESEDAYSFYFEKKDLEYSAGQYMKVVLDIKDPDDRGTSRFFTLSSSPDEDQICITTRIIQSSFKIAFSKLSSGQEISFNGPFGNFVLTDDKKPLLFLAGGIGITPFHSMIKYITDNKLDRQINLFVSWSSQEEMVYHEEFEKISAEHKNIIYVPTITHSDGNTWDGETGRIDKGKIEKHAEHFSDSIFYLSGPQVMVEAMEKMVGEMGITDEQIKTDKFPGY